MCAKVLLLAVQCNLQFDSHSYSPQFRYI